MKEKVESGEIRPLNKCRKNGQSKVDVKQATFKTIVNKGKYASDYHYW